MSKINYSEKRKKSLRSEWIIYSGTISFLCLVGLIYIISSILSHRPVERNEAISLSGSFDYFTTEHVTGSSDEEGLIYLEDGTELIINSIIYKSNDLEIQDAMDSLKKGARLQILTNPNNDYVMEIKSDTDELLTFDEFIDTMKAESYKLAVLAIIYIALLIFFFINSTIYLCKCLWKPDSAIEEIERTIDPSELVETEALRHADCNDKVKIKVRLEDTDDTYRYRIQYRRRKSTNELVVNDWVYDDKKCFIEQDHTLSAVVDGHLIEAGLTDQCMSWFIMFDGKLISYKRAS